MPIANPVCGASSVTITLSENVMCSSVTTSSITVAGHTVTAVTGANCAAGGTMENTFTVTFSPGLDPGPHTLCINGISDLCGNICNPADAANCRSFLVPGISTSVSSAPGSVCAGVSSTLTASGAATYAWSSGLGSGNPVTVTPGSTTAYTVTGTNGGCTSSAATTITVNPGPSVTINASANPICSGASITLTAGGATSYSWDNGLGSGNPMIVSPATTTTYTVTGTTAGCTGTAAITVTVNPTPTVTVAAVPMAICTGGSSTLTAGGATSYNWSGGLGTANPLIVNPGSTTSYTVTGTSSGCTNSAAVTVTVGGTLSVSIAASANPICVGGSTTLTGSGANTYNWSGLGAGNPQTVSPLSTTSYTVTGTDLAGCTGTSTITVNVNTNPVVSASATPASICAGASSSLTGSGATSYTWSGGLTAGSPTTASPASTITYTVTGTTAGCTGSNTVTVSVNPVTANAGSDWVQGACATSTNTLNGSGTGTAALTYAWTPATGLSNAGIATPIADPAATTNYTLTVTNGIGCTASDAATVTVNTLTVNAGADGNTGACPTSTYTLNGSAVGTAPITYSWTPTTALSNPAIANPVADPAVTTTYTLTVTDTYGCTASDAAIVNVATLPTAAAGSDVSIGACPSAANANLSGSGTGSGPLSYAWTPVAGISNPAIANPVADPAATTTYTLTVSDIYGCTAADNIVVTVAPLPTSNAGADAVEGGCTSAANVNLNGSGTGTAPLTYSWSPVAGLSNSAIANPVANPVATTSYTLTVADSYGCTSTDVAVITVDPIPTANAGADGNLGACAATGYNINGSGTGTGPLGYSWSPATGLSNASIANPIATPAGTTTYTLTVSDTYGCTATDAVLVTVIPLPTANAGTDANIGACPTSSATLNGSGTGTAPLAYSWLPVTGLSNVSISNPVAQPPSTTTYTLTVTDFYGCTATDAVTVTVNPIPTANAGADANIGACATSTATLNGSGTGSGSLSYLWTPAAGLSNPGILSPVAKPAATTVYTLTITDSYGCSASDGMTVTVNPIPVVAAGADVSIGSCASSNANLNGTATGSVPMGYLWTPSAGLTNPAIANPVAHPLATTNYTLTVTDTYGCSSSDALTITVAPLPTANAGSDATIGSCPTSTTTLNGTGTGTGISYNWTPAGGLSNTAIGNPVANPSSTTTYLLTITDTYGCAATDNMTVTVAPLPVLSISPGNPGICVGGNVNLTASGAQTYTWSPATALSSTIGASVNATPGMTTTYTVTGADAYGCTATASVTVTVTPLPVVSVVPAAPAICAGGSVLLTASGASTYNWSPAGGLTGTSGAAVTANPGATVTYTITGTSSGCAAATTVTVTVNPLPSVSFGAMSNICANSPSTTLNTGSPAGGIYTGAGITGTSFNPSAAGVGVHTLTYTYTDANNCTSSATQNINVIAPPVLAISPTDPQVCIGGTITLSASGATSYVWDPPTGSSGSTVTASPTVATTYAVTGTANGCTSSTSVTVNMYSITVTVVPDQVSICPGGYTVLTAMGASLYTWSPPDGLSSTNTASVSASPDLPTTYTVVGVDGNGCIGTATSTVNIYPDVMMNFIAEPQQGCPPLNVEFTFVPSPLVLDSSWLWDFGDGASGSNNYSVELEPTHTYYNQNYYIVSLTGTTTDGCEIGSTDTITVFDSPVADFIANPEKVTTENPEIDFIDQSLGAFYWNWNFGDPGSDGNNISDLQNTSHYYADSGYYQVTLVVENTDGCSDTAKKHITVIDAFAFYIPNAFTPNDDFTNPVFIPKGVGFKEETFEMWIFDRWGKKLFYTKDINQGWDGKNQNTGKVYEPGVYTYIISVKDLTNLDKIFHGSINLIK